MPGTAATGAPKVKTDWVGGNLVVKDKSGNVIFTIDGENKRVTFASGSLQPATKGVIPIDLFSNRLLSTNAFLNTIEAGTADGNTDPSLQRINAATDKAARLVLAANTTGEVQFHPVPLPPDLDDAADMVVHALIGKGSNTDTAAVIDVQAFFGQGDTECGGNTAALAAAAVADYTVTLAAADVPAYPNVLTLSLVPGAHANDAIHIYAIWVEYTRKL